MLYLSANKRVYLKSIPAVTSKDVLRQVFTNTKVQR